MSRLFYFRYNIGTTFCYFLLLNFVMLNLIVYVSN